MAPDEIKMTVEAQREFFLSGVTLDVNWRIKQLTKLKKAVIDNETMLEDALATDLGRTKVEAYLCDIGPVIAEINETVRGLRHWAKPETHFSGLMCFPSIFTKVYKMPYGVTLIISPFNFPILLTLGVLAASLAGGNTAVLKTSSKSSASSAALDRLISEVFHPEYVKVVEGGHNVADICLEQRFDKIFYTGSPRVAKHVMAKAAENLTPVALELGGETGNWCIVRKDADLGDAARKIAFLKTCNAGQICINVNQVAVAREVASSFIEILKDEFIRQAGPDARNNPEYPRLITKEAYDRCASLAETCRERIVSGGEGCASTQRYSPTIIYPTGVDEEIVRHELFCPLLPVVEFEDSGIDTLLDVISRREHPLALYLFTRDIRWAKKTMRTLQFGGGCINEVCVHLMVKGVPFGGTGHSGMGAYHGKWGFREFTHPQTVLIGKSRLNLSLREHPYSGKAEGLKLRLLRMLEK